MSDRDWNSVTSRRERKHHRETELREDRLRAEEPHRPHRTRNLQWFDATHPPPAGTAAEYDIKHAELYGSEEGMINGKHRRGTPRFPDDSERDIAHERYSESTKHRDRAEKSYNNAHKGHVTDYKKLGEEKTQYYKHSTGNLLPTQHGDLSGRALDLADAAWQ